MTIDNWTFDFERMTAIEQVNDWATREWYLMKLDDVMYVGQPNSLSPNMGNGWQWQYPPQGPNNWKSRDTAKAVYQGYVSYLLEKAIGFDFADEA